jgi:hypothetical protein
MNLTLKPACNDALEVAVMAMDGAGKLKRASYNEYLEY